MGTDIFGLQMSLCEYSAVSSSAAWFADELNVLGCGQPRTAPNRRRALKRVVMRLGTLQTSAPFSFALQTIRFAKFDLELVPHSRNDLLGGVKQLHEFQVDRRVSRFADAFGGPVRGVNEIFPVSGG